MFGGLAFLIGGNMDCGVMGSELMVRVGREHFAEALESPEARPMDFTGRPMKSIVILSERGLGEKLEGWVAQGASYAAALPPKMPASTRIARPTSKAKRRPRFP